MKYSIIFLALALGPSTPFSSAQPSATLTGSWTTADQSVVRVYACGTNTVCAQLVWLKDSASLDDKNPDPSLRKRALCGITLGTGFELVGAANAKGGKLYDPESGKKYSAEMTLEGNTLKVRGYIGISIFGRSEVWHRNTTEISPCKP
jgi:uncharacterized protein (DUF2147 family)